MQFSGKKTLILDWPSEAKRKVCAKEKGAEVESSCSTFNKHIMLRPSPRAHVLSLRRFPVVFSIVLVFILLFCFVCYDKTCLTLPSMCSFPQASLMKSFQTGFFLP